MRPEKINVNCQHCGHQWLQSTDALIAIKAIIFRGDEKHVKRRLTCPNCGKGVVVEVLKEWVEND